MCVSTRYEHFESHLLGNGLYSLLLGVPFLHFQISIELETFLKVSFTTFR